MRIDKREQRPQRLAQTAKRTQPSGSCRRRWSRPRTPHHVALERHLAHRRRQLEQFRQVADLHRHRRRPTRRHAHTAAVHVLTIPLRGAEFDVGGGDGHDLHHPRRSRSKPLVDVRLGPSHRLGKTASNGLGWNRPRASSSTRWCRCSERCAACCARTARCG